MSNGLGLFRLRRRFLSLLVSVAVVASVVASGTGTAVGQTHAEALSALEAEGILYDAPCRDGVDCSGEPVLRWVMAVWLVRALADRKPQRTEESRFSDVDANAWWAPHVEYIADLGITRGCGDGASFCPFSPVTRGSDGHVLQ